MSRHFEPTFNCCDFCPTEKEDLYKCPRCAKFYCSLRCYKSQKHHACSEEFYKRQCLGEEKASAQRQEGEEEVRRPTTTFEEYMQAGSSGQVGTASGVEDEMTNPQIEVGAGDEIVFDSDDEPEYLTDVCVKTMGEFEKLDADELDKRVLLAGLPGLGSSSLHADEEQTQRQMDALYATLTDDEKRAFKRLADEVMQDGLGLTQSCFASTADKKKPSSSSKKGEGH